MAKSNNSSNDDKEQREKNRKERETRDKKEQQKKLKEKDQKKKARDARLKKKAQKEHKRIKKIIDYPFKTLFEISLIAAFLIFIFQYFGGEKDLHHAILNGFLYFTILYLGFGVILVTIFFVISENKKKEVEQQKLMLEEQRKREDAVRKEELARIDEEIRIGHLKRDEEIRNARTANLGENKSQAKLESAQELEEKAMNEELKKKFKQVNDGNLSEFDNITVEPNF